MNRKKKFMHGITRKTVGGIKLPPMELIHDSDVKTVINIDPSYYSLIEDRPIRSKTAFNVYKRNIKEITMKRTVHGFLVDEILRIEREIDSEKDTYTTALNHFDEHQNSFNKFLADDNNKTIALMKKSDSVARNLVLQTEVFKNVNHEMASLKSKLQYIDETLKILISFQNFLNKAAPILWREKHKLNSESQYSAMLCVESINIFHRVDSRDVVQHLSKLLAPKLYFKTPDQLLIAFSMMEKQNLNYLLATEELNSEKNKFINSLNYLKKLLRQELHQIQQMILDSEDIIKHDEDKETELKHQFHQILENKIRFLVSSEMVLQVSNYVEFTYEKLVAPNETKLSSLSMVRTLETEYDNLLLDISAYNLNKIKKIEIETYKNTHEEIEQAQKSSKVLRNVDKLNRRLKCSYDI